MIAYLDLPSGLSGDMFLGCLIDVGWPLQELTHTLQLLSLPPGAITLSAASVMRGPIRATHVDVATAEQTHHRRLDDIRRLIEASSLPLPVKDRAVAVFVRLASAEAAIHGTTPDKIHFHEVGALDAIADIVGVCAGLHFLAIDRVYASAVPVGPGWVTSAHGPLPLPAPATLHLLASAHAPLRPAPAPPRPKSHAPVNVSPDFAIERDKTIAPPAGKEEAFVSKELVTPTAAALLAELATFTQPPMRLHRVGIGAGTRQLPWPNIARLWVGEPDAAGPIIQIDTNIDDMNPQFFPAVSDRLFAAGALDVWLAPIQMKKSRPAMLLSVLAPATLEQPIINILLRETTTLGVRVHPVQRYEAAREFRVVQTPHGPVRIKLKLHEGQIIGLAPEFEDCKKLADAAGLPLQTIHDAALAAAHLAGITCNS